MAWADYRIEIPFLVAFMIAPQIDPATKPKTWYNGKTLQMIESVFQLSTIRLQCMLTDMPLLIKLKCDSAAAFGIPVVPEVN